MLLFYLAANAALYKKQEQRTARLIAQGKTIIEGGGFSHPVSICSLRVHLKVLLLLFAAFIIFIF